MREGLETTDILYQLHLRLHLLVIRHRHVYNLAILFTESLLLFNLLAVWIPLRVRIRPRWNGREVSRVSEVSSTHQRLEPSDFLPPSPRSPMLQVSTTTVRNSTCREIYGPMQTSREVCVGQYSSREAPGWPKRFATITRVSARAYEHDARLTTRRKIWWGPYEPYIRCTRGRVLLVELPEH